MKKAFGIITGETPKFIEVSIYSEYKSIVVSPVNGIVIYSEYGIIGGNYIYIIGQDLKVYYFAHLDIVEKWAFVKKNELVGKVGNSGNAILKSPHLHFSIFSLLPIVQMLEADKKLGWKKMFYLDPGKYIK